MDPQTCEALFTLFILLIFLTIAITLLWGLYEFICFLLRPVYRWLTSLTTSKHERILKAFIHQLNQESEDYLNDILASLNNQRR